MRFSLKTLLALPLLAALTYWLVLPVIYSERYYVLSNLHIKGWDLNKMDSDELNEMIPHLPSAEELKKDQSGIVLDGVLYGDFEGYAIKHKIDGVTISAQPFGVAFETSSTRWHSAKAIRKVDREMRAFLKRNPDIGIVRGAKFEVYAYRSDGLRGRKKHQISFTRFDTYPPD